MHVPLAVARLDRCGCTSAVSADRPPRPARSSSVTAATPPAWPWPMTMARRPRSSSTPARESAGSPRCWPGQPFTGTILLTHLHWDHVQGLPFFRAGDRDDARVTAAAAGSAGRHQRGRGAGPGDVTAAFPDPARASFAASWTFGSLSPGQFECGGFTVQAREIPHKGGRTLGYRVSDGRSVVAYVTDHCPTALGPGPDGWGEYHAAAIELAAGADVLVHDAQLLAEEVRGHGAVRPCRRRLRGGPG